MKSHEQEDLSARSMLDLFRAEAEHQTAALTQGLLELERGPATSDTFAELMRAAHSLKGAARIVDLQGAVEVAHAMEDCFVAAQQGSLVLRQVTIDVLFHGVDLLAGLAKRAEATIAAWEADNRKEISQFLDSIAQLLGLKSTEFDPGGGGPKRRSDAIPERDPGDTDPTPLAAAEHAVLDPRRSGAPPGPHGESYRERAQANLRHRAQEPPERVLRLTAENLNRLLGLAGESLVESRWLRPFADSLQRLKRHHVEMTQKLDRLRDSVGNDVLSEGARAGFKDLVHQLADSQQFLADRMQELDIFDRRSAHLSQRLYLEVLRTRMRPFSDGVRRFPRMIRDLARALGKEVRLEVSGEGTQVDRDILERLETPLAHLLRNAVDHGCEAPEDRAQAGKSTACVIRLEARHSAGMLLVTVTDDGPGVDTERVRRAIVQKRLAPPAMAEKLTEAELLEFLFLPGFTLKEKVTEISGRGIGLDVVQNLVKSVRGVIRLSNQPGQGLRVQLQLPLTLSVLRALLVEVAAEPYAIPLSQITRALKLPRAAVQSLEGRTFFDFQNQPVSLLTAHQVLDCGELRTEADELPLVVLGERNMRCGLVVDRFLGERELVVQPLDPRLGKVRDISAAALMEDGAPVLIVDVEDVIRSIEKLAATGAIVGFQPGPRTLPPPKSKRVLAVDDSLTVRELERKLLTAQGYITDVAIDGMDAWHAMRSAEYDLIITDVDMPRMDGVELTNLIKKDPRLKSIPVLIVSYKDRQEDRLRGLAAGADYYLTKGSFEDQTLVQAVNDLIGAPNE